MIRFLKILPFCLLLLPINLCAQKAKDSYSSSSVLSSGNWFRIAVTADGIYRIDFAKLKLLGLTYPSNPKIYGNNFGQLSYSNDASSPDDLKELSIFISGDDNILNEGEYLLFFGKGTSRWIYNLTTKEYDFLRHNYSDTAFYFITSGPTPGKKIITAEESSQQTSYYSSESDALFIHEQENENLIKSGREWFQQISSIRINPGFTDLLASEKVKYSIRVAARASVPTSFVLNEGESNKSIQVPRVDLYNYTGTFAQITSDTGSIMPGSTSPVYEIKINNNGEPGAKGWVDYLKLQGRRSNSFTGSVMQYSDSKSVAPGRITGFAIRSIINDVIVWDVSDPLNTKQIKYTGSGENITFKAATDTLKTFIAFTPGNALIASIKPAAIPNQDLHSSEPVEMIIITHPLFRAYAEKLAKIHFNNNGLLSEVVTLDQVYNEFSGGIPDICAIRNFVRMKYQKQKGTIHPLKYLLLFGDGSYENKTLPPKNPNFIPTYQSLNSNVVVSSFTSDDFYGLLEDGEGEVEEGGERILKETLNIGIGRLPVSDTSQAGIVLSKIIRYLDPANMGDWKNVICLTADDEDNNTHISDAEGIATLLKDSVPSFNVEKIYLDAFSQTTTVNGQSYPDVDKAIKERINSGCLIFNYTGHGNENGLASERVIKTEDINSWKNGGKLPLFITATCEFSRFDDIEINTITREMTGKTSGGEMVLLNRDGGGIALMSTTRVVYSVPNYFLNKNIMNSAFDRDESGNTMCLGDIIRLAKNNSGTGPNKRNFTLLGDPALKLAYPWHGKVITDSINNVSILDNIDSLKALSLITVAGHIEDQGGKLMNTFNGVVSPLVYDKESKIKTLANDGGQTMVFDLRNNVLFSGKTKAKDGRFKFTFVVPRDIDYSFGTGKISYYAHEYDEDMNGSFTNLVVGGFSSAVLFDTAGPDIKLYMNDTLFRNGGITDNNPKLLAIIEDNGGINTTGSGIGHDLTGFLDNDRNKSFVLNNYYENDFDNYLRGRIIYDLSGLSGGSHSLTVKAWDNYNNSSEKSILFLVETGGKFILKNLINYPNPFLSETMIIAEHNRPEAEFDVIINIFNLNGRIIKIIKTKVSATGYTLSPVMWDGNDDGGKRVGRGMYPYTVIVSTGSGETARASGRMIIL
ncbi:MAG: type IX secretion system sortase PorU [Bacteroidia bacterium]|nr:type IX secretion system sortase PorU [Bacteroidia bacterium]